MSGPFPLPRHHLQACQGWPVQGAGLRGWWSWLWRWPPVDQQDVACPSQVVCQLHFWSSQTPVYTCTCILYAHVHTTTCTCVAVYEVHSRYMVQTYFGFQVMATRTRLLTCSKGLSASSWKRPLSSQFRRNLVGVGV